VRAHVYRRLKWYCVSSSFYLYLRVANNTDMVVDYETAVSLIYSVIGNMCAANKSKSGLPLISGPQLCWWFSTVLSSDELSLSSFKFSALFAEPPDVTSSLFPLSCQDNSPSPVLLLGDFNDHSHLWDCHKTTIGGKQFEDFLLKHNLSISWSVDSDQHGSDHFPIVISSAAWPVT